MSLSISPKARQRRAAPASAPRVSSMLAQQITALILKPTYADQGVCQLLPVDQYRQDQQRLRVLRHRETYGHPGESLGAAVAQLHQAGLRAPDVRRVLNTISVRLVLTAHPSEAKRQEVLVKLRCVADLLA